VQVGLVDTNGHVLGLYPYQSIEPMSEGRAVVAALQPATKGKRKAADEDDGVKRYGYIDAHGKTVIAPAFDSAGAFQEGDAVVVQHGNLGLIDAQGRVLARGAWMCGSLPVIVDGARHVVWPREAAGRTRCRN